MNKKITIVIVLSLLVLLAWFVESRPSPTEGRIVTASTSDTLFVEVPDGNGGTTTVDISNWKTYQNDKLGFSFRLPETYRFEVNDRPRISLTQQDLYDKLFEGLIITFSFDGIHRDPESNLNRNVSYSGDVSPKELGLYDNLKEELEKDAVKGSLSKLYIDTQDSSGISVWIATSTGTYFSFVPSNEYEIKFVSRGNIFPEEFFAVLASISSTSP